MNGRRPRAGPLRVLVVDDEPPARALLAEYLATIPEVELVGECGNGFEAVKQVAALAPDLLLLDVQMPKLDGFELLELLDPLPAVIFTTAHESYALRAFEVHAVDYLLKPFSRDRLRNALERAREGLESGAGQPLAELAAGARRRQAPLERLLVRDEGRVEVVATTDIDYLEARGDYVVIHARGRRHRKKQALAELEELLDRRRFVRVHRGYILNIDRLRRLEPYARDSRLALLADGTRLVVSRSGYARLQELLG